MNTPTPSSDKATPRTDAAVYQEDTGHNGMVDVVSPQFARQLEHELAEANALLAEISASQQNWIAKCAADVERHNADLAQLSAPSERIRACAEEEAAFALLGRACLEDAKEMIRDGSWDEQAEITMEAAAKFGCGNIQRVTYDPKLHGEIDAEEGTEIWYWGSPASPGGASR